MADLGNRISIDPQVLVGKPVVRGTRIAVERVIELMAAGWTEAAILDNHPQLTRDDIHACLAYAALRLSSERVYPAAG